MNYDFSIDNISSAIVHVPLALLDSNGGSMDFVPLMNATKDATMLGFLEVPLLIKTLRNEGYISGDLRSQSSVALTQKGRGQLESFRRKMSICNQNVNQDQAPYDPLKSIKGVKLCKTNAKGNAKQPKDWLAKIAPFFCGALWEALCQDFVQRGLSWFLSLF